MSATTVLETERPAVQTPRSPGAPRRRRRRTPLQVLGRAVQYLLLAIVVAASVGPLYWIVVTAFRPDSEIAAYPPRLLPSPPTGEHFRALFEVHGFHRYLLNSGMITLGATALTLVLGVMASYAIARFRYRGVRAVSVLSLVSYLLPGVLVLVPVTQILFGNGLGDNRVALMVLYVATLLPFAMWILRSYFQDFAIETEEAAMLDGCSRFGAFVRIVLPQATPALVSTAIFVFNAAWSEYLFASTLMTTNEKLPANAAIFLLMGHMGTESWGLLMAGAVTIVLPILVVFAFLQRWLVQGLSQGGGK